MAEVSFVRNDCNVFKSNEDNFFSLNLFLNELAWLSEKFLSSKKFSPATLEIRFNFSKAKLQEIPRIVF